MINEDNDEKSIKRIPWQKHWWYDEDGSRYWNLTAFARDREFPKTVMHLSWKRALEEATDAVESSVHHQHRKEQILEALERADDLINTWCPTEPENKYWRK